MVERWPISTSATGRSRDLDAIDPVLHVVFGSPADHGGIGHEFARQLVRFHSKLPAVDRILPFSPMEDGSSARAVRPAAPFAPIGVTKMHLGLATDLVTPFA